MTQELYVGVDGTARRVKAMYVGVDGIARKVTNAYIGIDGLARQFFGKPASELTPEEEEVLIAYVERTISTYSDNKLNYIGVYAFVG